MSKKEKEYDHNLWIKVIIGVVIVFLIFYIWALVMIHKHHSNTIEEVKNGVNIEKTIEENQYVEDTGYITRFNA